MSENGHGSVQTAGPSRRRFIKIAALGGGGLALGVYLGFCGEETPTLEESWGVSDEGWFPNAWLRVDTDGSVTIRVNHTEMGQGVTTGLPTIVADELDLDWQQVRFEIAPVEPVYKNPLFGVYATGGSTSVKGSWDILRHAGAVARAMLVQAAAETWGVSTTECRTELGAVLHDGTSRRATYGELSEAAARITPPDEVNLKDFADFRLIGTDVPRLDLRQKIDGSAVFGTDVQLPGLLTATVVHPPVYGDGVQRFNADKTIALPGVRSVLEVDTGVAVVANTFWQAKLGADALEIEWDARGDRNVSNESILARWTELAGSENSKELLTAGDVETAWSDSDRVIEADYFVPYEAHATAEPMCCTAFVERDRCQLWVPTQNQDGCQEVAARITGLGYSDVDVYTTYTGGGFGRRVNVDYVIEAIQLSKAMDAPVKVLWTREEDIQHDFYRPACFNVMRAALDGAGNPTAWFHQIVGPDASMSVIPDMLPSILPMWLPRGARNMTSWIGKMVAPKLMYGEGVAAGAVPLPYAVDNVRVDYVADDPGVPVGFWRSVSNSANAFVVECFVDEMAAAAGRDPLEYRLALLGNDPHHTTVLEVAAREAGWGTTPENGVHRGLAVHEFDDTYVAMVAEISIDERRRIKVQRVVCGVDCGRVINPRIVRTQIASAIAFGLTATLKGESTFEGGRARESNFHDFPILTFAEMPDVEVHLVNSDRHPSGIGEGGVPPIAPAVANAVYAATGVRLRKLPLELE